MRLPVPGPRDVLEQLEGLVGLVPRLFGLVDRVDALLSRIEQVTEDAAAVVTRVDRVVDTVEPLTVRLATLLDGLEPALTTLQPTLERLAETTDPDEVAALVTMIDQLPELTRRLEQDILPIMGTMGSVAPDLHDLLSVSQELNEMLAKLPGMGRIKKRIDEQQDENGIPLRD